MHIVHRDSTDIQGIEVTTTNECELNSGTPRIAALWGTVFEAHYGQTLYGTPIYAGYTSYESDPNGQDPVILGVKSNGGDANQGDTKTKHPSRQILSIYAERRSARSIRLAGCLALFRQ